MTSELVRAIPCPRCKDRGYIGVNERKGANDTIASSFTIQCFSCGRRGRKGPPREAVDAWNDAHAA